MESLTELADGRDGRVALAAGRHAVDEGLVDLERVDREAPQVAQRRVAGAEVVEGQPDPEVLEQLDLAGRLRGVLREQRFGDLEREQRRLQARALQGLRDIPDEVGVLELAD